MKNKRKRIVQLLNANWNLGELCTAVKCIEISTYEVLMLYLFQHCYVLGSFYGGRRLGELADLGEELRPGEVQEVHVIFLLCLPWIYLPQTEWAAAIAVCLLTAIRAGYGLVGVT